MKIELEAWSSSPQARVAFAYSTKDRTDLSIQSLEPLRETAGYDLYWMDGSNTDKGRLLPSQVAPGLAALREVHYGVTGGPDVAIVYALTYLLQKGYDYVGLIENDVLLTPGWLERLLELFDQGARDGLRVGAVSARTIRQRALFRRDNYAVMFNLGAAMIMFSRNAALAVLERYRTTNYQEVREIVCSRTGFDIASAGYRIGSSADWFFDAGLLLDGYCSLATVPSLAKNIDGDLSNYGLSYVTGPADFAENTEAFELFRSIHQKRFEKIPVQTAPFPPNMRVAFPHHLAAAMPGSISPGWTVTWRQGFGPFALQARDPGATITLPLNSCAADLLMEGEPNAGEVEIRLGNESCVLSLKREKLENMFIQYRSNAKSLHLRVMKPNVVWYGVHLLSESFSFPRARAFDFSVLRPFV